MAQYDITVEVGAPHQIDVAMTSTNVRPLWLSAWSSIVTYAKNNMVKYQGSAWISLVNGNLNQQPNLTPLSWELMVEKGDDGEAGPGGTDSYYRHVQSSAATTWTVVHNLNKRPSVMITDSAGTQVFAQVNYLDDDSLEVLFSAACSGEVLCN